MSAVYKIKLPKNTYMRTYKYNPNYNHTVFRLAYIVKTKEAQHIRDAFSYFLEIPYSKQLAYMLQSAKASNYNTKTEKGTEKDKQNNKNSASLPEASKDYVVIVPTYVLKGNLKKGSTAGQLYDPLNPRGAYYSTLPDFVDKISVHTPTRVYPLMCLTCTHTFDYFANECSPMHYKCTAKRILTDDNAKNT